MGVLHALIIICYTKSALMERAIVSEFTLHCSEPLGVNQTPSSVTASHHSLRQQLIRELCTICRGA